MNDEMLNDVLKRMDTDQLQLLNRVRCGLELQYNYDNYDGEYHDALIRLVHSVMNKQRVG